MSISRAKLACRFSVAPLTAERFTAFLFGQGDAPTSALLMSLLRLAVLYRSGRPGSPAGYWFNLDPGLLVSQGAPITRPTLFRLLSRAAATMPTWCFVRHETHAYGFAPNPLLGGFGKYPYGLYETLVKQSTQGDVPFTPVSEWAMTNIIAFVLLGRLDLPFIIDPDRQDFLIELLETSFAPSIERHIADASTFDSWSKLPTVARVLHQIHKRALTEDVSRFRNARMQVLKRMLAAKGEDEEAA